MPEEVPSEKIKEKVMSKIHQSKMAQTRAAAFFYAITSILSLGALWPIFSAFLRELSRTEFFYYASLLLYEGVHMNGQWKYWAASTAAAFPFTTILVIFIIIAILHSLNKLTFCLSALIADRKLRHPAKHPSKVKAGNIIRLTL